MLWVCLPLQAARRDDLCVCEKNAGRVGSATGQLLTRSASAMSTTMPPIHRKRSPVVPAHKKGIQNQAALYGGYMFGWEYYVRNAKGAKDSIVYKEVVSSHSNPKPNPNPFDDELTQHTKAANRVCPHSAAGPHPLSPSSQVPEGDMPFRDGRHIKIEKTRMKRTARLRAEDVAWRRCTSSGDSYDPNQSGIDHVTPSLTPFLLPDNPSAVLIRTPLACAQAKTLMQQLAVARRAKQHRETRASAITQDFLNHAASTAWDGRRRMMTHTTGHESSGARRHQMGESIRPFTWGPLV